MPSLNFLVHGHDSFVPVSTERLQVVVHESCVCFVVSVADLEVVVTSVWRDVKCVKSRNETWKYYLQWECLLDVTHISTQRAYDTSDTSARARSVWRAGRVVGGQVSLDMYGGKKKKKSDYHTDQTRLIRRGYEQEPIGQENSHSAVPQSDTLRLFLVLTQTFGDDYDDWELYSSLSGSSPFREERYVDYI